MSISWGHKPAVALVIHDQVRWAEGAGGRGVQRGKGAGMVGGRRGRGAWGRVKVRGWGAGCRGRKPAVALVVVTR